MCVRLRCGLIVCSSSPRGAGQAFPRAEFIPGLLFLAHSPPPLRWVKCFFFSPLLQLKAAQLSCSHSRVFIPKPSIYLGAGSSLQSGLASVQVFLSQGFASAGLQSPLHALLAPWGNPSLENAFFLAEGNWERDCGLLCNFTCLQPPPEHEYGQGQISCLWQVFRCGLWMVTDLCCPVAILEGESSKPELDHWAAAGGMDPGLS